MAVLISSHQLSEIEGICDTGMDHPRQRESQEFRCLFPVTLRLLLPLISVSAILSCKFCCAANHIYSIAPYAEKNKQY